MFVVFVSLHRVADAFVASGVILWNVVCVSICVICCLFLFSICVICRFGFPFVLLSVVAVCVLSLFLLFICVICCLCVPSVFVSVF